MPDEIKDQIDAMLKIGESTVTDAPFTESVATEAPGTNAPGTEAPKTNAPSTDAPTTKAPEDDELERIKKENESLRKQVADAHEKKTPATKSPGTKAPATEVPFEEIDFLGKEIDLDDLTRNPDMLNKILNKVYKLGSDTSKAFQETTLRNIPDIVKSNVVVQG
jgi:hypothetical protein